MLIPVRCRKCKIKFKAKETEISRGGGKYCSQRCFIKHKHKTPEQVRAYKNAWSKNEYKRNPSRRKYLKLWYKANGFKYRKKNKTDRKKWELKHPIKAKRAKVAYRLKNWKKYRYQYAKREAKKHQKGFNISQKFYYRLLDMPCNYCGGKVEQKYFGRWMDRINNRRGYYPDNVVPCCVCCNRLRSDILTPEETKIAVGAVLTFRRNCGSACDSLQKRETIH